MKQEQITQFIDGFNLDANRKQIIRSLINTIIDVIKTGDSVIATTEKAGNIKLGYKANDNKYPLLIDEEGRAYVAVPFTNTTYNVVGANGTTGLIKNGSNVTSSKGYVPCPIINGIPYYKESVTVVNEPAVAVLEREK